MCYCNSPMGYTCKIRTPAGLDSYLLATQTLFVFAASSGPRILWLMVLFLPFQSQPCDISQTVVPWSRFPPFQEEKGFPLLMTHVNVLQFDHISKTLLACKVTYSQFSGFRMWIDFVGEVILLLIINFWCPPKS